MPNTENPHDVELEREIERLADEIQTADEARALCRLLMGVRQTLNVTRAAEREAIAAERELEQAEQLARAQQITEALTGPQRHRAYRGEPAGPLDTPGSNVLVVELGPEGLGAGGPSPTPRRLNLRLDLARLSPTGFAWGYGGSGPAQLALAILAEHTGDDVFAQRHYQEFKAEVIAAQPQRERFWLAGDRVDEWVRRRRDAASAHREGHRPAYFCASELCPGYPYRASEYAHPASTCTETGRARIAEEVPRETT